MYKKLLALSLLTSISIVSVYGSDSLTSGTTGGGTPDEHDPLLVTPNSTAGTLPVTLMNTTRVTIEGAKDNSNTTLDQYISGTITTQTQDKFNHINQTFNNTQQEISQIKNKLGLQSKPFSDVNTLSSYAIAGCGLSTLGQLTPLAAGWVNTVSPLVPAFVSSLTTKASAYTLLAKAGTAAATCFTGYFGAPLLATLFLGKCAFDVRKEYKEATANKKNAEFSKWVTFKKHCVSNIKSAAYAGAILGAAALFTANISLIAKNA